MNINEIEKIVHIFEGSTLSKMELQSDDVMIKLEKEMGQVRVQEQTPLLIKQPVPVEKEEVQGYIIKSPLVGTFYNSNIKDGDPLICVGDTVKKGDILCVIEAMKMMNEIRSDVDGVILSIDVENEMMVEFDQPMITVGDAQ